jgi:hypothetical protein
MHECFVELRVVKAGPRASSFATAGFTPDGEDFVFQSRLEPTDSVSEHLKWLHGIFQFERRRLRKLQEDGVDMVCRIRVRGRTVSIEPEALLLMHKCHLRTEISFNP